MKLKKIISIKIPDEINVIYCNKKNQLTFIVNSEIKKSITPLFKIFFSTLKPKKIYVTCFYDKNVLKIPPRNVFSLQKTFVSSLRKLFTEQMRPLYQKIKLVGVGYKVFNFGEDSKSLMFKLGHSHPIYYQLPKNFNSYCIKFTKLFLFGKISHQCLEDQIMCLRRLRLPEPYKGKGVLHYDEKVKIKIGKRI